MKHVLGGGTARRARFLRGALMINQPIKKRDVLKPWLIFRSAIDGRYVSRAYALLHPDTTVSERRWA